MITILLSSRVKGNKDSDIGNLLGSLQKCGGNAENCEVLIKYDTDDSEQPAEAYFSKFPFPVKKFTWSRGEGRHGIHLDHFYLFSQRNLKSRFMLLVADDFTFTRSGFIKDILAIKDEFCFVGPKRPRVEVYKGHWREPAVMNVWKHSEGGGCLPCVSVRCIEVLQNYGWQPNGDGWITLLQILMFEKYGIDMWRTVAAYYARNPTKGTSGYGPSFNNMTIDGSRNPTNQYFFTLVEQQAKNLYLNMREAKSG